MRRAVARSQEHVCCDCILRGVLLAGDGGGCGCTCAGVLSAGDWACVEARFMTGDGGGGALRRWGVGGSFLDSSIRHLLHIQLRPCSQEGNWECQPSGTTYSLLDLHSSLALFVRHRNPFPAHLLYLDPKQGWRSRKHPVQTQPSFSPFFTMGASSPTCTVSPVASPHSKHLFPVALPAIF